MDNTVTERTRVAVSLPTIPRHPSWFTVVFAVGVAFSAADVLQTWANWRLEMSPLWTTFGFDAFLVFTALELVLYVAAWRVVHATRWRRPYLAYIVIWALWQGAVALWNIAVISHVV